MIVAGRTVCLPLPRSGEEFKIASIAGARELEDLSPTVERHALDVKLLTTKSLTVARKASRKLAASTL